MADEQEEIELTLEGRAAIVDCRVNDTIERAKAMIRQGTDLNAVRANAGLPLREVYRLAGEVRREEAPPALAKSKKGKKT
jgi:hypothetical protein